MTLKLSLCVVLTPWSDAVAADVREQRNWIHVSALLGVCPSSQFVLRYAWCYSAKKGPQVLKMHKFDNTFFILLSKLSSIPTDFEGGFQYVDAVKGKLCLKMIPSDVTLLQDERFSKWVYLYRKNCQKFGENLTSAFAKLDDVEPVELPQV